MTDKLSRQQLRWLARKDVKAYVKACPDVLDTSWAKSMKMMSEYCDVVLQHDILRAALVRKFGPDILDKRIGDVMTCNVEQPSTDPKGALKMIKDVLKRDDDWQSSYQSAGEGNVWIDRIDGRIWFADKDVFEAVKAKAAPDYRSNMDMALGRMPFLGGMLCTVATPEELVELRSGRIPQRKQEAA